MIYENYSNDKLEEHFSNYLIDSWSYSKVATFSRDEKEFEMRYIYRYLNKISATSIAGSAYHEALKAFFIALKTGENLSIIEAEQVAFDYINNVDSNSWKLQKTTPTIEDCINSANKVSSSLISNFYKEQDVYTSELQDVLEIEVYIDEWLTINGVDIPLPCHMQIDEVFRATDGRIILVDHKSKKTFSSEEEKAFLIGKQAITYVKGYEKKTGLKVDEVWFIENKSSKNRDGSNQLNPIKVKIDEDSRKLYEAMLYEPLRRMIQAVSDPDYVYMINDNNSFVDRAEIYNFWAKTMIAEVDEFNVDESKKDLIQKRLKKIRNAEIAGINPKIISDFKNQASKFITYDFNFTDMTKQDKIEHILKTFGIDVQVRHTFVGFSSDTFLLEVGIGTKITSVISRKKDIANALDVSNVRISDNLFVYEDKSYIKIEVSKKRTEDLFYDKKYISGSKIPFGLDNFNQPVFWDTENPATPHVLICGQTGSGKSVSIISTIEYAKEIGIKEIIIFDPKYEFAKLNIDADVYSDIEDIETMMEMLVETMKQKTKTGNNEKILIIFDEFADAVSQSRKGNELNEYSMEQAGLYANGMPKMKRVLVGKKKSLEQNLQALLQKGRSCGFRIIAATQRASVKVINGDAKVNFPVQVCFRVDKDVSSKVVLDEAGAESLAGKGDGLFKSQDYLETIRFQGFFKQ